MKEGYKLIEQLLANLRYKPAWGLRRTYGSMFFLEVGNPLPRTGTVQTHGEWHFLMEMCHWRFEMEKGIVVGSDDDQGLIDAAFQRVELGAIEEISARSPSHDLHLVFSSGIVLHTFAGTSAEKD